MPTKFRRLTDEAFFFGAFSVLSGGYTELPLRVMTPRMDLGDSNPFNSVAMVVILGGLLVLGGTERHRLWSFARQAWPMNVFLAIAAVSAIWSVDPSITLRRTTTLTIGVVFGYYAASAFSMPGIIRRIGVASIGLALSSALVALTLPQYGVMSGGELAGRWNGVFPHKQQLGQAMFLGVLALGWLTVHSKGWYRTGCCAAIALCIGVLAMARSETSVVSVLAIPPMALAMRAAATSGVARLWAVYVMSILAIVMILALTVDLSSIMEMFGRDATLTGRAPLWGLLLEIVAEQPFTGYGYGAFWLAHNPLVIRVIAVSGWYVPEAHNGYIDVMLQVGVPGLILALAMLFGTIRAALAAMAERVDWASFAGIFVIIATVSNLVETMVLRSGDVQCVLIPLLYVALRAPEAARREAGNAMMPGMAKLSPG